MSGSLSGAMTFTPSRCLHARCLCVGFTRERAYCRSEAVYRGHLHSPGQTPLSRLDRALGKIGVYQYLRPLLVGIIHGLAGSASVALLVMTTIRDSRWAIAYLLLIGVGTIQGMMLITLGVASTFRMVVGRRQSASHKLAMASGLLSMAFVSWSLTRSAWPVASLQPMPDGYHNSP
jgi:hypothetical protein